MEIEQDGIIHFGIDVNIDNTVIINPTGKYEIMVFFDYNCSYCKKELQIIKKLLETRKDIKVIIKAIPILGELSFHAAEIGHAILVSEPNKYLKYLGFVMDEFNFNDDLIYQALLYSNVNVDKIRSLVNSIKDAIDKVIQKDLKLSQDFGITSTPSIVINNEVINGIFEFEQFKEKIFSIL